MKDLLCDTNKIEDPATEVVSYMYAMSAELTQLRKLLEAFINTTLTSSQKEKLLAEFDRLQ